MNKELMEALDILEKEKEISKETLFEAIENSLLTACKNHFGKADNVKVEIDRKTCDFLVYAEKEIVSTHEEVEDDCLQIALEDALEIQEGKGGRCHPCGNQVQGIWTYRHPEREKRHPAENQGRRKKRYLQSVF